MTQEQKQFIIKALESGIPAIAQEHIAALEEVAHIAATPLEQLNGMERYELLNQERYSVTVKVIQASAPYMAAEYVNAYNEAVNICNGKFAENTKAREAKEKAENAEEAIAAVDKKKKSA